MSERITARERPGSRRSDGGERHEVSLTHLVRVGSGLILVMFV